MAKFCIICCKKRSASSEVAYTSTSSNSKSPELIQRFFKLVGRYVDDNSEKVNGTGATQRVPSTEKVLQDGILSYSCKDCSKIVDSFCKLYHEMKSIEVLLNWKLETLADIISTAQSTQSRIKEFRENAKQLKVSSKTVDEIFSLTNGLILKCERMLRTTFPRVAVQKYKPKPREAISASTFNDDHLSVSEYWSEVHENGNFNHVESNEVDDSLHQEIKASAKSGAPPPGNSPSNETVTDTVDAAKMNLKRGNVGVKRETKVAEGDNHQSNEDSADIFTGEVECNPKMLKQKEGRIPKLENSTESGQLTKSNNRTAKRTASTSPPRGNVAPPQPSRRSLRVVHHCKLCKLTFSSSERLAQHQIKDCSNKVHDDPSDDSEDIERDKGDDNALSSTTGTSDTDESEDESRNKDEKKPVTLCQLVQSLELKVNTVFPEYKPVAVAGPSIVNEKKTNKLNDDPKIYYRFKCPDCSNLFYHLHDMLSHRMDSHDHSIQDTEIGGTLFVKILSFPKNPGRSCNDNDAFETFANIEVPQQVHICKIENCKQPFYSPKEFENHSKLHGKFKCNFCEVVKEFAPTLAYHELQHAKTKSNKRKPVDDYDNHCICPRCKIKFIKKNYIDHHLKEHLSLPGMNGNACGICKTVPFPLKQTRSTIVFKGLPQNCARKRILFHYKKCHDKGSDYSNPIKICEAEGCTAYFLKSRQLVAHLNLRHGTTDKRQLKAVRRSDFSCKDCDKNFVNNWALHNHRLKVHVNVVDIIKCTFENCKILFETNAELEAHKQHFHKAAQQLKSCPKCQKQIYSRSAFTKHMKFHKRREDIEAGLIRLEDNHVCETCGKSFKEKARLKKHYLSHSGPESWEFMCSVCSKKCMNKHKLAEHMTTHSGEKPYVCDICGQKYAHRHNLRIHVNSKHGSVVQDIPRKCERTNLTSRKGIKRKQSRDDDGESSTDTD